MSSAWSWQNCIQIFYLLVSMIVFANFVRSWFGISVRGSLQDGDKAIRRQGAVDWVKMGEQSMVEGMFFFLLSTFSNSY